MASPQVSLEADASDVQITLTITITITVTMTDLEGGHDVSYTNVDSKIEFYTLVPAAPSVWETSSPPPGPPPPSFSAADPTMTTSSVPTLPPLFSSDQGHLEQSSGHQPLSPLPSSRKRSALASLSTNLSPSPSKTPSILSSPPPKRARLELLAAAPATSGLWRADLPFVDLDDDEFEKLVQSHNASTDAAIAASIAAGKERAAATSRRKTNELQAAMRRDKKKKKA